MRCVPQAFAHGARIRLSHHLGMGQNVFQMVDFVFPYEDRRLLPLKQPV
jgi:hypothetical protein